MASSNVSSVVNHFPTANEGFTTTTSGSILSGAATVPLNSVSGLTNGTVFVGIIEPGQVKEQTFTGTVDTAGTQITGVKWTRGSNVDHSAGVTVVDYVSGTGNNMITKGILVDHGQIGDHDTLTDSNGNEWLERGVTASAVNHVKITNNSTGNDPIIAANGGDTNVGLVFTPKGTGDITLNSTTGDLNINANWDGWINNRLPAVSSVTNNGNRSYDITFASTVASLLSPGMRLRSTRTVTAPTQCTSLNGTTQYYSRASGSLTGTITTITDDITISAWVKLTSYAASTIVSRYNGTSGWTLDINASGQVQMAGFNGGVGNNRNTLTYQSIPLNKWVHVSVSFDMSVWTTATNKTMIDGVDVPITLTSNGTNPTAWVNAGNLEIGARNGGLQPFAGKLAQIWLGNGNVSTITQATVRALSTQGVSGAETSCFGAWSFNNTINDLNSSANNLTANGSAVATNADSPFANATGTPSGTTDVALVMAVSGSTATVQVPEGCTIPTSGGVSAVAYSTTANPFGWVADKGRWLVSYLGLTTLTRATPGAGTYYNDGVYMTIPTGKWDVTFGAMLETNYAGSGTVVLYLSLHTATAASGGIQNTASVIASTTAGAPTFGSSVNLTVAKDVSSATVYYLNEASSAATTNTYLNGGVTPTYINAVPAGI